MIYDVSHRTTYRYSAPVAQSQHIVHMSPRAVERQRIKGHTLLIEPAPTIRTEREDYFGNRVVLFDIEQDHTELIVQARSTIGVTAPKKVDRAAAPPWEEVVKRIADPRAGLDMDIARYACASKNTYPTPDIAAYARPSFQPGRSVLEAAWDLVERIYDDFTFDQTATDVSTPVTQVLQQRRGVCQDFSHLALACLRAMRISARYVSGYILTRPPPGVTRLAGADASHAWISAWCPGLGWVDADPTNNLLPGDRHLTVAWGRDFGDVSPIRGVAVGGGDHELKVAVDVLRENG